MPFAALMLRPKEVLGQVHTNMGQLAKKSATSHFWDTFKGKCAMFQT